MDDIAPRLKELYAEGKTIAEIARLTGFNNEALRVWLVKNGVHKPNKLSVHRAWTEDEKAILVEMRKGKASFRKIAEVLGRNYDSVRDAYREKAGSRTKVQSNVLPEPDTHVVVGKSGDSPDELAERICKVLVNLGSVMVVRSKGGLVAAAIPGTRVALQAEREGAIVGTYSTEARDKRYAPSAAQIRSMIAGDLRHAQAA